jgi:DNA topoisomerase-6 subunit A
MARKANKTSDKVTLTSKDKKTLGSIRGLADEVVQAADRGRAPYVEIRSRSLSNVRFNQSKRIIEMGTAPAARVYSIVAGQKLHADAAGRFRMQAAHRARQDDEHPRLFYLLKHTIEGTREETFDTQERMRPIIEDVEVALDAMREELHLYAKMPARWWADNARRQRR